MRERPRNEETRQRRSLGDRLGPGGWASYVARKSWHFTSPESHLRGPLGKQNNQIHLSKLFRGSMEVYFRTGEQRQR